MFRSMQKEPSSAQKSSVPSKWNATSPECPSSVSDSTTKSCSNPQAAPPAEKPSKWKTSNSTNASVYPASKTIAQYRSSLPMVNSNSWVIDWAHLSNHWFGSRRRSRVIKAVESSIWSRWRHSSSGGVRQITWKYMSLYRMMLIVQSLEWASLQLIWTSTQHIYAHRLRRALCSMHLTNRHLYGRSSSWAALVNSLCAHILAYRASGRVRFLPLLIQIHVYNRFLRNRHGQTTPHHCQIRDSILHCVRYPSPIPQNRREKWISSFALGTIHHTERGRLQVIYSISPSTIAANKIVQSENGIRER